MMAQTFLFAPSVHMSALCCISSKPPVSLYGMKQVCRTTLKDVMLQGLASRPAEAFKDAMDSI